MTTPSHFTPILSVSGYRKAANQTEYVNVTISPGDTVVAFRAPRSNYFKYLDSGLFTLGRHIEDYIDELLHPVAANPYLAEIRRNDPGLPPPLSASKASPANTIKIGEVYTNGRETPIVPTGDGRNVMIGNSKFGRKGVFTHAQILTSTYKPTGKRVREYLNSEYGTPIATILMAKLRSQYALA